MRPEADYEIVAQTDTCIVIVDLDQGGRSVTNDAERVICDLSAKRGGIEQKKVYYRDSMGRFDELKVKDNTFDGFVPCSDSQQKFLRSITDT